MHNNPQHPLANLNYRWNSSDFAIGYDAAADKIHPYYLEIQDAILDRLSLPAEASATVVDLGGGSGRLMERILDRWPHVKGVVIDQSEPFLALAERRLARFGPRGVCLKARLQDDWRKLLAQQPKVVVSTSAIHHLEPWEKLDLFEQCFEAIRAPGTFLNGDEVRPVGDAQYLAELEMWATHMRRGMADGSIGEIFHPALHKWIERNVTRFGEPKHSGDDCHETIDTQLEYLRQAGFAIVDAPWHKGLWAVLRAMKA